MNTGARTFDPVFDSQRVFRCVLQATAHPGKLFALPPTGTSPWEPLALALLDHEVTFCAAGEEFREMEERVARTTGARISPLPEVDFAVFSGDSGGGVLDLGRGTLERPETGATAIYSVDRLSNAGPLTLKLSGPGIPGERTLGVDGIAAEELAAIRESREGYPLGVDVYLVDGSGQLAGLPRSTRLEEI